MKKIYDLTDNQLATLIDNRWNSSDTVWDIVIKSYDRNLNVYKNDGEWIKNIPIKRSKVRKNRVFVNTEAVINSLIANLPQITILPGRDTPQAKTLAQDQEKYFQIKYVERNVKETMRKGLRNLYFSRLIVIKPFWDPKINDFNARAIDPKKLRIFKAATKTDDSEFAIEEIDDTVLNLIKRFPAKKKEIMEKSGYAEDAEDKLLIDNPDCKYKEAWINDYVCFKYENVILGKIRNPYWDWDGLMITPEEEKQLLETEDIEARRNILNGIKDSQDQRKTIIAEQIVRAQQPVQSPEGEIPQLQDQDEPQSFSAYYYNHFDQPRKPYIIATLFNNESKPIGQTDMIAQATPLQQGIDETKQDIAENRRLVNGQIKVDSTVMSKADAQKLRYEARGIIWGKGVKDGVTREMGEPLPNFVMEDMRDSEAGIDDIMAASSAFKGQREGQETKAGRLALIEQSFLRLNELVQVIDYVNYELFNWFYQLAKVRYTEHHYAKTMGKERSTEIITLVQDDFQDGAEVRVIGGKTLPEDRAFKYEQAQQDVEKGIIAPTDYLEIAGYDMPEEKAKNKVLYGMNPAKATGVTDEELSKYSTPPSSEPPSLSIKYEDVPPDAKLQMLEKAGIKASPVLLFAEETAKVNDKKSSEKNKTDLATRAIDAKAKPVEPAKQ